MLVPFFAAAMIAPGRQLAFRRAAVGHVVAVALLSYVAARSGTADTVTTVGYALLALGMVEGAALVGWRLTQLPKSQALEFLLTSPIQPQRLFLAEAAVGMGRYLLVWFAGLPVLGALVFAGAIEPADLLVLAGMPLLWGLLAGLGLTAWIYEPPSVRRLGELAAMGGVMVYLVVGVVAAENLRLWLEALPPALGLFLYNAVKFAHDLNPFGVVRYWFTPDRADPVAWDRLLYLNLAAGAAAVAAAWRAAARLVGHYHDRHYRPIDSSRLAQTELIGDRPLSWWAVKRVMEYSGRVNLWLAGGFSIVYAAYIVAGDAWPAWMGRLVFQLLETWGGAPALATALVVMATVPAVFQFGLWDATPQDRCRRLELLLLTDLGGRDYWHASLSASWKRGRGYLVAAALLWLALGVSGRAAWPAVVTAAAGAAVMWSLAFAVGFRAFAAGAQTSGAASLLTLGVPLALGGFLKIGWTTAAYLLPTGLAYLPLCNGVQPLGALAATFYAAGTVSLTRYAVDRCDPSLRAWYDRNQGLAAAG